MKFTIITSTYNAARELPVTAASLARQTFRDFEWIIVDGASTDGTNEVVRGFGAPEARFFSERDSGIFNAWNKAIQLIAGEWVLFLGAGDALYDAEVLARVNNVLAGMPTGTTVVYGKVEVEDSQGRSFGVRDDTWDGLGSWWGIRKPGIPSHQAVFQRASIFAAGFRFDETMKICADSELMLGELVAGRGQKMDILVSRFRLGGVSQLAENKSRKSFEFAKVYRKLGLLRKRPVYQAALLANGARLYLSSMWQRVQRS